jgi:acyl-coenzyme A thioesterase PaaI-like protein
LTHLAISREWVGEPLELAPGTAVARLLTRTEMAADERGMVHGGFAFGLADYAAMLAVNDPYVVLGAAETRFLAPVRVGEVLTARAVVESAEGKKRLVKCSVMTDREVLAATFTCFVLPMHVFDV